jgi:hypothetical protein
VAWNLAGIILEAGAKAGGRWGLIVVARCLAVVAVHLTILTLCLAKLALSATAFTIRV